MLFTEAELYTGTNFESVLSEAVYLTEQESMIKPKAIPVVENKRLNVAVVDFKDIATLAEDYDITFIDAIDTVAEANNIEFGKIAVSVNEASIIETPEIVDYLNNVVVKPISENDEAYQCVSLVMENYINDGIEAAVDLLEAYLLDEASISKMQNQYIDLAKSAGMSDDQIQTTLGRIEKLSDKGTQASYLSKQVAALKAKAGEDKKKAVARKIAEKNYGSDANARNRANNVVDNQLHPEVQAALGGKSEGGANTAGAESAVKEGEKALTGPAKPGVISRVIASLRRWAEKVQKAVSSAPAEKRSLWMKIKNKIASLIEKLTKKLQSDEKYAAANAYHDSQKKA